MKTITSKTVITGVDAMTGMDSECWLGDLYNNQTVIVDGANEDVIATKKLDDVYMIKLADGRVFSITESALSRGEIKYEFDLGLFFPASLDYDAAAEMKKLEEFLDESHPVCWWTFDATADGQDVKIGIYYDFYDEDIDIGDVPIFDLNPANSGGWKLLGEWRKTLQGRAEEKSGETGREGGEP